MSCRLETKQQSSGLSLRFTGIGLLLAMSGLAGCSALPIPDLSLPDLGGWTRPASRPAPFESALYVSLGMGSSGLSPDTSEVAHLGNESSRTAGSRFALGYDYSRRVAFELESAVLGEAELGDNDASVRYSSLGISSLIYTMRNNRNKDGAYNIFLRLGGGVTQHSSSLSALDDETSGLIAGLGFDYTINSRLGIRAEATRYDSESSLVGLALSYRFGQPRTLVAKLFRQEDAEFSTRVVSGAEGVDSLTPSVEEAVQATSVAAEDVPFQAPLAVRRLASADDRDLDGVPDGEDRCPATEPTTAVATDGCGLFDGRLANDVFTSGSARLNESTKASLDQLAIRLSAFPEVRVAIEGHTDNKGPADINENVSRTRAEMVRDYLVRKGVGLQQLEIVALGESRPIGDNSTEQGRDMNRRIEFRTLPDQTLDAIGVTSMQRMLKPTLDGQEVDADHPVQIRSRQQRIITAKSENTSIELVAPEDVDVAIAESTMADTLAESDTLAVTDAMGAIDEQAISPESNIASASEIELARAEQMVAASAEDGLGAVPDSEMLADLVGIDEDRLATVEPDQSAAAVDSMLASAEDTSETLEQGIAARNGQAAMVVAEILEPQGDIEQTEPSMAAALAEQEATDAQAGLQDIHQRASEPVSVDAITPSLGDINDAIRFEPGKDALLPRSHDELGILANNLNGEKHGNINIITYASDAPDADNATLSMRRARIIVQSLIDNGVSPARLNAIGRGSESIETALGGLEQHGGQLVQIQLTEN